MSTFAIEHITQPAILVANLDEGMDWLHAAFGIYPSERMRITNAGIDNAVYPFRNLANLELIYPYKPESAAGRLLQRTGPGWHMLTVDLVKAPFEKLTTAADSIGLRIVARAAGPNPSWQFHPKDTHGVLFYTSDRDDHDDLSPWVGHRWRDYIPTNCRVVQGIAGVSLTVDDIEAARETYMKFGLTFRELTDRDDLLLEATTARGTVLQLRKGRSPESDTYRLCIQRGPGLYHLIWNCDDLISARRRLEAAGGKVARETPDGFWTVPGSTLGVTMEFRHAK